MVRQGFQRPFPKTDSGNRLPEIYHALSCGHHRYLFLTAETQVDHDAMHPDILQLRPAARPVGLPQRLYH